MLGFALLCAAIAAAGYGAARRLLPDATRLERLVTGALLGAILWIAVNWAFAITFALTRRNLLIAAGVFVVVGLASLRRPERISIRAWSAVALAAIALWCAFVLWRGSVVPPASHDVLTYHLPKAVMIDRAHGYGHFDAPDRRITSFPSNYELLLADVLLLGGSDRLTEWIGTAFYLLFLGVTAMFARRWWGGGVHVAAAVLAAAGAPLLLLHSGHDKNDVMTAVFAAAALYWSAQWCVRRGAMPAALAIACGVTAVGTKMTAGAVAVAVAPFGIAALILRPPRFRAFAGAVLFAVCALLLCGGWVFVRNAQAPPAPHAIGAGLPGAEYGEWRHLWQVPYLATRASLGLGTEWPWPADNLFASHYGPLFALAVLALPFCIWRYRRDGDEAMRRERAIAGIAAAVAFFILVPLAQYPRVPLPSILRYTAFILPVLYGWTVAPLVRSLASIRWVHGVMAFLVALFAANAIDMALNDALAPLAYARWCAAHPGTREIFWASAHAASAVDRMAGAHDKIAFYGRGDAWIYPAYGAALARPVFFVNDIGDVPVDAQWVVIDHLPAPNANLRRFYDALVRDPRFRLVYRREKENQAVFRRIEKEKGPRV